MKANIRLTFLSLIVIASLASYVFLHHRSIEVHGSDNARPKLEQVEEAAAEGVGLQAPELMFLEKVYETARRLVPMFASL